MFRNMATKAGSDIGHQLKLVLERINMASQRRMESLRGKEARLVAVSKTKPVDMILEAYQHGQRHFGENYVNELVDKSNNPQILESCADVRWHFIGNLQKKNINKLLNTSKLHMVETVDSERLAVALNKSWSKRSAGHGQPLAIMIQVNTSGEENKNGVAPSEASSLALFVQDSCPDLRLTGLMTIGSFESSTSSDQINPDFQCLVQCRQAVAEALGVSELDLELSMGMSHDFEKAVEAGSTNVRIGSTIFGSRSKPAVKTTETSAASPSANSDLAGSKGDSTDSKAASNKMVDTSASDLSHLAIAS